MRKTVGSQTIANNHYLEVFDQKSNLEQKLNEKAKPQQLTHIISN